MKRILIILGLVLGAVIAFTLGLMPGENMLTSDHPASTESYVLMGTGRAAALITAVCEFALGGLVAALWIIFARNTKKTEPGG